MHLSLPLLLALVTTAFSASLTLYIPPSTRLPNPAVLPPTTHATLHAHGPPRSTSLSRKNTFEFTDLEPGSYLATIHCRDYHFETLRVDVTATVAADGTKQDEKVTVWQTFRGNEWDNRGERRGEGGSGLVVEVGVGSGKEYYQMRQGFSPMSFLKNPMILMAVVSMGLIFGMPYLMDNMDPETKAEFEEMRKTSPLASSSNPAAQIQNFDLASWMAGKTTVGSESVGSGSGTDKKGKR
ncbi:hypothetical protein EJ05DRAFT_478902 [Pseudovirgaria hyperparasitica]|uniref:ER membrane protein complex subunit 7 beta-sandwich domain-containing protein n=1 Tax=Pseudovirgaria hyperparasitica TaxID=470096 RepID=A0A6A6VXX1_9PEZI|nr:uncharacterized protein EJ05DRAFT_478902 [Pseudovirgaria hyperparasitica]KAF2755093.1 hypothetical protein EJ05DRAFT_478902 [Pseudovirgaria hyperparasitica]